MSKDTSSSSTPKNASEHSQDAPLTASSSTDAFLSSMSFAQMQRGGNRSNNEWNDNFPLGGGGGCDCDECGWSTAGGGLSQIPAPIQEALDRYKRRKLESGPMKRTQHRSLQKRALQLNVAVWNWTLPQGAEPLLEFGNSHRFVWIRQLPGQLYSLGQGIIGSEAEEKMRRVMSWQKGSIYFVPSRGGKAVGWVHKAVLLQPLDSQTETTTDQGDQDAESSPKDSSNGGTVGTRGLADLVIAKIPTECLESVSPLDNKDSGEALWACSLMELCRKYSKMDANNDGFVEVSKEDTTALKNILL